MYSYIKSILTVFNRGHAVFASGAAISLLFPIVGAPIVSRLYSPADFGVYAIYYAICNILIAISSFSMQHAITNEATKEHQIDAMYLSAVLAVAFAGLLCAAIFLIGEPRLIIISGLRANSIIMWIPVTVMLGGLFAAIYNWNVKTQRYKELGKNKVVLSAGAFFVQIGIGLSSPGPIGFVLANVISLFFATVLLYYTSIRAEGKFEHTVSFVTLLNALKRNRRFAIWMTPGTLVNVFAVSIPDLLLGRFFGTHTAGQYSLGNRMLDLPLSFLTTSLQDIIRQQASDEYREKNDCSKTFGRFFVILTIIAIAFLVPLIILMPIFFPIIFGSQWVDVGALIQAVSFLLVVRFIAAPLSYVWYVVGNQKANFYWQVGLVIVSLLGLGIPTLCFQEKSVVVVLKYYSFAVGGWYLLNLFLSWRFSLGRRFCSATSR